MTTRETYNQFHRFQLNREGQWAPYFKKALNKQVQQFATAYAKGATLSNALMEISRQQMRSLITAVRIDGATVYGAKVAAYLPKYKKPVRKPSISVLKTEHYTVALDMLQFKTRSTIGFNQRMINLINLYFEGEILADAEGITDTTRKEIQRILKQANEQGKGITWMVTQMEDLNSSRTKLIARTETVTAANAGGFLAALDVGLMMQKEWLGNDDGRERPAHIATNGQRVNVTDYFRVGGEEMLYPGDRTQANGLETSAANVCNCRCTVLYKPVRVDGKLVPFDYSQFRALVG